MEIMVAGNFDFLTWVVYRQNEVASNLCAANKLAELSQGLHNGTKAGCVRTGPEADSQSSVNNALP